MPTIKHLPNPSLSLCNFYNTIAAIKSTSSFNINDLKPKPKPEDQGNDTAATTCQAVPIASLQLINNIREQKEKSHQLQQQKRKPQRDR